MVAVMSFANLSSHKTEMARLSPFIIRIGVACCIMFALFSLHWLAKPSEGSGLAESASPATVPSTFQNIKQINELGELNVKQATDQLNLDLKFDFKAPPLLKKTLIPVDRGPVLTVNSLNIDNAAQLTNLKNRFVSKQNKQWWNYNSRINNGPKQVFSDVCYEYSSKTANFVYKYIFKTGEDELFSKLNGYNAGQGGRHAILDQGVSPVGADPSSWSYPATEGQDKLVLELLDQKRGGFFVDLAARYWQRGSNSFALETYFDWQGICIEPDNNFARGLVLNRTCLVICNNPITERNGDKVHFNYKIGGANSKGNEVGEKVTTTLMSVLDAAAAPRKMDYLSLDVEDHELAVLTNFDFAKYQFNVMTVERPAAALHTLLNKHGYRWLTQLRGNFGETVYIHESIPGFAKHMNHHRPVASSSWRGADYAYLRTPLWDFASSSFKN